MSFKQIIIIIKVINNAKIMKTEDDCRARSFRSVNSVAFGGLFPLEDRDPLQVAKRQRVKYACRGRVLTRLRNRTLEISVPHSFLFLQHTQH